MTFKCHQQKAEITFAWVRADWPPQLAHASLGVAKHSLAGVPTSSKLMLL